MGDEAARDEAMEPKQLLVTAADALARRRDLDGEIARLVDEPFDPAAPDRVRTAQARASAARFALTEARSRYGPPPWTVPDAEPAPADAHLAPHNGEPKESDSGPSSAGDMP